MKKLLLVLLTVLMAFSLVACSSKTTDETGDNTSDATEENTFDINAVDVSSLKLADTTNYIYADSSEIASMDYVTTALATNHEINVNLVDGLVEADNHGNYVGSLAESWEMNDDKTVWTFHLRKGANWVTSEGEVYDEVKAEDFVTGLRHAAEFQSGTGDIASTFVKGFEEYYYGGDYSDEAWANVGVRAVDDYTVEYTLTQPADYFDSVVEYTIFYPINKDFLESKGEGCKLGSPDVNSCTFGSVATDAILYNGAYILSQFDAKSQTVLTKNANYWDADAVKVETVTIIYDEGSDPYSVLRGFEQNTYAQAGLPVSNPEVYEQLATKYDGYTKMSLTNGYAFGIVFNYNRQTYDNTNYATDTTLAEHTKAAIQNENFRLALKSAFDVESYLKQRSADEVAMGTIRNMNGVYDLVTTSDGKLYGQLVEEAYAELTGETVSLEDGQWPWLSKEKAIAYLDAAQEELGFEITAENPIHLDMLVPETSSALVKQGQSMKQSVEENTDGRIVIELVMRDLDTVQNIAYYTSDYTGADYDISTFTGWGPDYQDPSTFVAIYNSENGYYMHSIGLTDTVYAADDYGSDDDIKEAVGFTEYTALYKAASAITDDMDARYEAFAKADAYLLAHGLYIPTSMQTRATHVTHIVPFSAEWSYGVSQYKLKGLELQEDLVTSEQFAEAKAAFDADRASGK